MSVEDDQFPDTLLKNPEKSHQMMETPMAFGARGRRLIDDQMTSKVSEDRTNPFLLFINDHYRLIISQRPTTHCRKTEFP